MPTVLGWGYSQVRNCNLERVASDLASLFYGHDSYGMGVGSLKLVLRIGLNVCCSDTKYNITIMQNARRIYQLGL